MHEFGRTMQGSGPDKSGRRSFGRGGNRFEEVGDDLPSNSSALLVAFENLWLGRMVEALQAADAVVIDSIRIPANVVQDALAAG